jgi:hypothetical protein
VDGKVVLLLNPQSFLLPQQNADRVVFPTTSHHINFTVSIYICDCEPPGASAREKRRRRRRLESASTIAKHRAHSITRGRNHVLIAILIQIRESDAEGVMAKVEWRAASFNEATTAITNEHRQVGHLVMTNLYAAARYRRLMTP